LIPKNIDTRPGLFAAGEVVTGAKIVVHAVEAAKNAAQVMTCFMEQSE
jgi:NADPH-dependent glutamate synthase beta subunit-like oxidoreductase